MALNIDAGDSPGFLDDDVAASLDAAVPVGDDFVVLQADIATALGALAGLCFADGRVRVTAIETGDLAGGSSRIKDAL